MQRQHAVVAHQIGPRPRNQGRERLQRRERLEEQLARAIRPRALQREHHTVIVELPEPVLRHRRPEQIALRLFQARAIRCRHRHVGVQIQAGQVRVPRHRRQHPRRVGIAPRRDKTEAVYRRYAMVAESELREAGAKLAAMLGTTPETATFSDNPGDDSVTARNTGAKSLKKWWAGTGLNRRHQDFQTDRRRPATPRSAANLTT